MQHIPSNRLTIAGFIVNHDFCGHGTVVIDTQTCLIIEIRAYDENADIAGWDLLIIPGIVDPHVHFRKNPTGSHDYKETPESGSLACINGGVVAVATMPNVDPAPTTDALYAAYLDLYRDQRISILPYYAIANGSLPLEIHFAPGKCFLGESFGNLRFNSSDEARDTLQYHGNEDVSAHCDDNAILKECAAMPYHEDRRPGRSEVKGIKLAIEMAREFRFRNLKIVHCSTSIGWKLCREAIASGLPMMVEAPPFHALFDRSCINDANRTHLQVNPPLREKEDREATWLNIQGSPDHVCIGSDHAPHNDKDEKSGTDGAPVMSGLTQADTLGAVLTEMNHRGISWETLVKIACYNPGRWINQYLVEGKPEMGLGFGKIAQDYIGSIAVIDPNRPWVVTPESLFTKAGWSPFEQRFMPGFKFPGQVVHTIIKGQFAKQDGIVLA